MTQFHFSELLLPAADFSRSTKLSYRAGRGVANLFIIALPVAMFFHVGFFTRMTDASETLAMLFLYSTVAGFSWLAGHGLRLIARIVECATADQPVWMFPARLGRVSYRMSAESLLESSRFELIRRMRLPLITIPGMRTVTFPRKPIAVAHHFAKPVRTVGDGGGLVVGKADIKGAAALVWGEMEENPQIGIPG